MEIKPYRALRPRPELADQVASLPYDVVTTEEARALASGNALSMLHVVRAEIDLPEGTSPYSDEVYEKAKKNFLALQEHGVLIREDAPSLYLYEQRMGEHCQRGVVALCRVEDYERGLIKRHEKTRRDKEDDRTRLTDDLSANPGPVFLTYRPEEAIDREVEAVASGDPLYDFVAEDGIAHRVWRITDPDPFVRAFAPVPAFYVADGHHRAASAARVGRERAAANPNHTGEEPYSAFLTVLFPADQLQILPYNRLVADLNGHSPEQLLSRIGEVAQVSSPADSHPKEPGEIHMYLDGTWHALRIRPEDDSDPVSRLDVSRLQDRILAPLLGIDDPRTSDRIEFVGGIRGTKTLAKAVDRGEAGVAFSLYPVTVDQLMDIADADQIMPPKSTWFEPKLRSGLFIHSFG